MDRWRLRTLCAWLALGGAWALLNGETLGREYYAREATWQKTLVSSREGLRAAGLPPAAQTDRALSVWHAFQDEFAQAWDWLLQDCGPGFTNWFTTDAPAAIEDRLLERALGELGGQAEALRAEWRKLEDSPAPSPDPRRLELYARICEQRRAERLRLLAERWPRIVFTKHPTLRPSFLGYTEGQSDAQNERHFRPGSALCVVEMDGPRAKTRTLFEDPDGAIRDPAVSWDASRVLFAWKKSLDDDDYHLYELELASGLIRQVTFGLGFADYEPAYLPNGDIIFASTRCVQTVDCWWTEVSNLYTCDAQGRFLRRLGFDQVHTLYPQVLDDGRVLYLRWDYNDRSQMFPQALFVMNPDGTGQTEFYKNQSWFPTTIVHTRGIPGTARALGVFTGHHTAQAGKLGVIDPALGRQENSGAQLVAPIRPTPADRQDMYGQRGELFQYPFPLTETEFLVTYAPLGWEKDRARRKLSAYFAIYWMDMNGRRELLAADPEMPCNQPVPLAPRRPPPTRPNLADYREQSGLCYLQDIYTGPGLAGAPRGSIKKLRVIGLEYRPAGVGNNGSIGPSGEALVCTPISIGNGSWDVKIVLGDARVHEDGSAFFRAPARMPLYFQALDDRNRALQTMRSWSTLQPGEIQSCTGCHEHKNTAPSAYSSGVSLALKAGPQALEPFYGPPRGFSFPREIQPILDRHCVRCHHDRERKMTPDRLRDALTLERDPPWKPFFGAGARGDAPAGSPAARAADGSADRPAFSLRGEPVLDKVALRRWSDAYLNLTQAAPSDYYEAVGAYFGVFNGRVVNWIGSQSVPTPLPPGAGGAIRSELLPLLESGHGGARLSREELDKLAAWIDLFVPFCGDYTEANAWSAEDAEKYRRFQEKRKTMEALERQNIEALMAGPAVESGPRH